jgi:Fe-S-cluster containining protein
MLVGGGCSIYEHRPRTCRTYDCRVFAAAKVEPEQPLVAERVGRWEWRDQDSLAGVRTRAATLRSEGAGPTEAAVRAVLMT